MSAGGKRPRVGFCCVALACLVILAAGCSASLGGPNTYTHDAVCKASDVTRWDVEDPTGVVAPPALPSLVGRVLPRGVHRVGLEINPILFSVSEASSSNARSPGVTFVNKGQVGISWQGGILDSLSLGAHLRHSLGFDSVRFDGVNATEAPRIPGTLAMGISAAWNFRIDPLPLAVSVIGDLGMRSRRNNTHLTEEYVERCDVTCYATDGLHTDKTSGITLDGPLYRSGDVVVNEAVFDIGLAVQGAWEVMDGVAVVGLGSFQRRSQNYSKDEHDEIFADAADMTLHWQSYSVVNLGVGVDLWWRMIFGKVLLFKPIAVSSDASYGGALHFATGVQF